MAQTSLEAALRKKQELRRSLHRIAKDAGVSVTTVRSVLDREYQAADLLPSQKKRLRGYVEPLVRLSLYVGLTPEDVLQEYGVSLSWAGVADAIQRVRGMGTDPRSLLDSVIEGITARNEVRVGVLNWKPFSGELYNEGVSWAHRYCRRMLRSLNPGWNVSFKRLRTIADAIAAVTSKVDACDMVFGINDTPARRLMGITYIRLPGIGSPLGALYCRRQEGKGEELQWRHLALREDAARRNLRPSAINLEVAHGWLVGVCGYEEEEIEVLDEAENDALAAKFLLSVLRERKTSGMSCSVFVADQPTCTRVYKEITKDKPDWLKHQSVIDSASEPELRRLAATVGSLAANDQPLAPVYRLGLAILAGADRWRELLQITQTEELFWNAREVMAREYAQLFVRDLANQEELQPLPLEPELPKWLVPYFCTAFEAAMQGELPHDDERRNSITARWIDTWRKEA